jgi:zinc transport system ATP-binding protein
MKKEKDKDKIVHFSDVQFRYPNSSVPVLSQVRFSIYRGDFVSIIGPNGGGKTTLARLMLGLLHPTAGTIRVFGSQPASVRRKIGYVPQYSAFDPRFPVTVLEVVMMGRLSRFLGMYTREDRNASLSALEEVDLLEQKDHSFAELSGGQRQRTLIARALAGSPEMLLLDEPTANVDAAMEKKLYTLLSQLNERMTVALITHDLGFVSDLVTRVLCVNRTVRLHPTTELTGETFHDLYGQNVRMVQHSVLEHPHE